MSLTFPTRALTAGAKPSPPGTPFRAAHCVCEPGSLLIGQDDDCLRCGRPTRATVSETWRMRAREIALQLAKRGA